MGSLADQRVGRRAGNASRGRLPRNAQFTDIATRSAGLTRFGVVPIARGTDLAEILIAQIVGLPWYPIGIDQWAAVHPNEVAFTLDVVEANNGLDETPA